MLPPLPPIPIEILPPNTTGICMHCNSNRTEYLALIGAHGPCLALCERCVKNLIDEFQMSMLWKNYCKIKDSTLLEEITDIPTYARSALSRAGYLRVRDILKIEKYEDLLKIRGVGEKIANVILDVMGKHGFEEWTERMKSTKCIR